MTSNIIWTPEKLAAAKEGHEAGLSPREIAADLGVTEGQAYFALNKLGFSIPAPNSPKSNSPPWPKRDGEWPSSPVLADAPGQFEDHPRANLWVEKSDGRIIPVDYGLKVGCFHLPETRVDGHGGGSSLICAEW